MIMIITIIMIIIMIIIMMITMMITMKVKTMKINNKEKKFKQG